MAELLDVVVELLKVAVADVEEVNDSVDFVVLDAVLVFPRKLDEDDVVLAVVVVVAQSCTPWSKAH